MNNHVKLIFALEHVAHLEDLIEGNEWEQYLSQNLSTMKYEFERQLSLEEDKLNVTTKRKNRDGETYIKKFISKLGYRLINFFSDIEIPPDVGDFRIISKRVANQRVGGPN